MMSTYPLTLKLGRHQLGLSHPRTSVWMPGGVSTNTTRLILMTEKHALMVKVHFYVFIYCLFMFKYLENALVSRHQKPACHFLTWLKGTRGTENNLS